LVVLSLSLSLSEISSLKIIYIDTPVNASSSSSPITCHISTGLASRNDVFPIYIGDDQTDEDAFKVFG
jgi:trehalose-6-phosphatase